MRTRALLTLAVTLLVLGSLVTAVPLHATTGTQTVDRSVATYSLGDDDPALRGPVWLYVDGPRSDALAAAFDDAFAARGVDTRRLSTLRPDVDGPLLVVLPGDGQVLYTPVFSRTSLEWRAVYVASGNVSQWGHAPDAPADAGFDQRVARDRLGGESFTPVVVSEEVRYVREADLELRQSSTGAMTWAWYESQLARIVADETVATLDA
jgi:hypothetical protein